MKQLGVLVLILACSAGCDEATGFRKRSFAAGQFVQPTGDKQAPAFASLAFAFAFTLRDVGGRDHAFVHNVNTGLSEEASVGIPGAGGRQVAANDDSVSPSTNASGRLVAFLSAATNLLPTPTSGRRQAFVRDLDRQSTELVSKNGLGEEADAPTTSAALSGNGRFVVFATKASNLVPGVGGTSQIYVYDRFTDTVQLISRNLQNIAGNGPSIHPVITPDGRFVAYESGAGNLVVGDSNGLNDVYLYDRSTNLVERISDAAGGGHPVLSGNAGFVVFESIGAAGLSQVFCADRAARTLALVSFGAGPLPGNGDSSAAAVSADGRFVAFQSDATNLVAWDTNDLTDIFLFDQATVSIARVSVGPMGEEGDADSVAPTITPDGRQIAFQSTAFAILPNRVPQGFSDIFLLPNPLGP